MLIALSTFINKHTKLARHETLNTAHTMFSFLNNAQKTFTMIMTAHITYNTRQIYLKLVYNYCMSETDDFC